MKRIFFCLFLPLFIIFSSIHVSATFPNAIGLNDAFTVSEALSVTARALSSANGDRIANTDNACKNYLISHGVISSDTFDSTARYITRHETATLLSCILPTTSFPAITDNAPADITPSMPFYEAVNMLYKAGVFHGANDYGDFLPNNTLSRAEAFSPLLRVINPSLRYIKDTPKKRSSDDAYLLCYNDGYNSVGGKPVSEGINSGWVLDNRGGSPRTSIYSSYNSLSDVSTSFGTSLTRRFNKTATGRIHLQTVFTISANNTGVYIEYVNEDNLPIYRLQISGNAWKILTPNGNYTKIYTIGQKMQFSFDVTIDLDNGTSHTAINGTDCGDYPLLQDENCHIKSYRFGTTEASTAVVTSTYCQMTVNYVLYENSYTVSAYGDHEETFEGIVGLPVYECVFNPTSCNNFDIFFSSGDNTMLTFSVTPTTFSANGEVVYDGYSSNVYYDLRITFDTGAQTADVRVNGRKCGIIPFDEHGDCLDSVYVTDNTSNALTIGSENVFRDVPHDDYVPQPIRPKGEEKYNVGINVCSIWRNGEHYGWQNISPFDDIEPVLGYYDEASPETADWEIKYLVEHGVDFQAFCWFSGWNSAPLYPSRNCMVNDHHLIHGYMNAKYADDMKYCLIWEVANGSSPTSLAQWKTYFVPYFIEHYFKDDRYMTVDNKPLFYIFTPWQFYNRLGGMATAKKAFDYLEEEVKKLGFDGMLYIADNGTSSTDLLSQGYDGTAAYGFGTDCVTLEKNIQNNLSRAGDFSVYTIPTIFTGNKFVGWGGVRYPMSSAEEFKKSLLWARDTYIPTYAKKGTWQENLFMLATWNEYGEGAAMMPMTDNTIGFHYLDAVREVFTDEKADETLNTVPTAEQKRRINRLYDQDFHLLRKLGYYAKPTVISPDDYTEVSFIDFRNNLYLAEQPSGVSNYAVTSQGVSGTTGAGCFIAFGNSYDVDLDKCDMIKITAKIPVGQKLRFYYTTRTDSTWNETKAQSCTALSVTNIFADYYFDMREQDDFKGKLLWYRIDPCHGYVGQGFVLQSIHFLKMKDVPGEESLTLTVNDTSVEMQLPPMTTPSGDYLIAFDPKIGMEFLLNSHYSWDKDSKTLTLLMNAHTLVFTVGDTYYTLDGTQIPLPYTLEAFDGLPMLPIKRICDDVGYTFAMTDGGAVITTTEKQLKSSYYSALSARKEHCYEFDVAGDTEGFSSSHMSLLCADGYLYAESLNMSWQNPDPVIYLSVSPFSASSVSQWKMRVRYAYTPKKVYSGGKYITKKESMVLYFITSLNGTWSESQTLTIDLKSTSTGTLWEEYQVSTAENANWAGNIIGLRFDPFNANGKIIIDYFRLE